MEVLDFPDKAQILFLFSMKTLILPPLIKTSFGKWRSPVAHLYGVQGVASSNLVFPTKQKSLVYDRAFCLQGNEACFGLPANKKTATHDSAVRLF